jgi:hypothetical protein
LIVSRGERLRRVFRLCLRTFVLVVTVAGVMRAGSSYLYCSMTKTIGESPCCKHGETSEPNDALRAPEMECCQAHVLPTLPAVDRVVERSRLPEPRVTSAVLSRGLAPQRLVSRDTWQALRDHPGRAGPRPPRYASDVRAALMIFLC